MRLFVVAELPGELLDALSETSARLRPAVAGRFVGTDLFHVTLAFLGEVPVEDIPSIAAALQRACARREPFHTTLGELGTFGRRSSAVLWQGFCEGGDAWQELAQSVRRELVAIGYEPEHGRFVPHVTLMRHANVTAGSLPMPCIERGEVRSVALFRSDLSGDRPRYEALERVALK